MSSLVCPVHTFWRFFCKNIRNCNNLKKLRFTGLILGASLLKLCIKYLPRLPQLKDLSMDYLTERDFHMLTKAIRKLPKLDSLSAVLKLPLLKGGESNTLLNQVFSSLFVRKLELTLCDFNYIKALLESPLTCNTLLPNLEFLSLSVSSGLSSHWLCQFVNRLPRIKILVLVSGNQSIFSSLGLLVVSLKLDTKLERFVFGESDHCIEVDLKDLHNKEEEMLSYRAFPLGESNLFSLLDSISSATVFKIRDLEPDELDQHSSATKYFLLYDSPHKQFKGLGLGIRWDQPTKNRDKFCELLMAKPSVLSSIVQIDIDVTSDQVNLCLNVVHKLNKLENVSIKFLGSFEPLQIESIMTGIIQLDPKKLELVFINRDLSKSGMIPAICDSLDQIKSLVSLREFSFTIRYDFNEVETLIGKVAELLACTKDLTSLCLAWDIQMSENSPSLKALYLAIGRLIYLRKLELVNTFRTVNHALLGSILSRLRSLSNMKWSLPPGCILDNYMYY